MSLLVSLRVMTTCKIPVALSRRALNGGDTKRFTLSFISSYTGVYAERFFSGDGRINGEADNRVGRRYMGNTNTGTDETIHSIAVLMRPSLHRGGTSMAEANHSSNRSRASRRRPATAGGRSRPRRSRRSRRSSGASAREAAAAAAADFDADAEARALAKAIAAAKAGDTKALADVTARLQVCTYMGV